MRVEVTDTELITIYEYGEQMADGTFNYIHEGFRVRRALTDTERAALKVLGDFAVLSGDTIHADLVFSDPTAEVLRRPVEINGIAIGDFVLHADGSTRIDVTVAPDVVIAALKG